MRRLALVLSLSLLPLANSGVALGAGFTNASVAGTWVCLGSGSATVKGAPAPVATSTVGTFVLDAKGNFTGGKSTGNTGGTVCSYNVGSGSTYTLDADGNGTSSIKWKAAGSNPAQCPPAPGGQAVFVLESASSSYVVGTDSDGTAWNFCNKRK